MQTGVAGVRKVLGLSLGAAVLGALLSAPAAAQFTLFDWTLQDDSGDSVTGVTADTMNVIAWWPTLGGGAITAYKAVAPFDCRVMVDMWYMTFDGFCGASVPVFLQNGVPTILSSCTVSKTIAAVVPAGTEFGFGLQTFSGSWPGYVQLTNFQLIPIPAADIWTDLGSGLAGAGGTPKLVGTSLLQGGYPFELAMTGALPSAPTTLVLGFSQGSMPFKGGVVVPSPDILLTGLVTDAAGSLRFDMEWPSGIPPGFTFYLQGWVVDASGPQGLAASNGLKAKTL